MMTKSHSTNPTWLTVNYMHRGGAELTVLVCTGNDFPNNNNHSTLHHTSTKDTIMSMSCSNQFNHHAPYSASRWTTSLSIVPLLEDSQEQKGTHKILHNEEASTTTSQSNSGPSSSSPHHTKTSTSQSTRSIVEINILSFNILAESYLTPRSHKNLPEEYASVVFDKRKRQDLLCSILFHLATQFDILCFQEVDNLLFPMMEECLMQCMDFGYVYSPRNKYEPANVSSDVLLACELHNNDHNDNERIQEERNGNRLFTKKDSRSDGCATFFNRNKWKCVNYEIVHFDDLADDTRPSIIGNNSALRKGSGHSQQQTTIQKSNKEEKVMSSSSLSPKQPKANQALPGIITSYKRRNTAQILRLQSLLSSEEIVVGNAHLYWHPGYEFVKLSQAHYLLHKMKQFAGKTDNNITANKNSNICLTPIIVCGDMNSKPNSVVHQYFTKGHVDARTVAPWYHQYNPELGDEHFDNDDQLNQDPIVGLSNDKNNNNNNDTEKNEVLTNDGSDLISSAHSAMDISKSTNVDVVRPHEDSNAPPQLISETSTETPVPAYGENDSSTSPKYLLDITLNKLTRWLRILGLDAELETEEEEKARTGEGKM